MTNQDVVIIVCTVFCLIFCIAEFIGGKLGRAYYELKKTLKLESLEGEDDE